MIANGVVRTSDMTAQNSQMPISGVGLFISLCLRVRFSDGRFHALLYELVAAPCRVRL